jgi:hypothetical protein
MLLILGESFAGTIKISGPVTDVQHRLLLQIHSPAWLAHRQKLSRSQTWKMRIASSMIHDQSLHNKCTAEEGALQCCFPTAGSAMI